MPRLTTLPPRLTGRAALVSRYSGKTLKQRQAETGRTLALDGAAWKRLRASVLSAEPLCRRCRAEGLVTPATDVDHIDNDPSNDAPENHQPLCRPCHSRKTAEDHAPHRPTIGLDGWPVGG